MTLGQVRKFITALVGVVVNAVAAGVLPDAWVPWAVAVISIATATGVYVVPNDRIPLSTPNITIPPDAPR